MVAAPQAAQGRLEATLAGTVREELAHPVGSHLGGDREEEADPRGRPATLLARVVSKRMLVFRRTGLGRRTGLFRTAS